MTIHIASDAADARVLWEIPKVDVEDFEREALPPQGVPLRILVDDGQREYALPWAYQFRDDDFFAVKTGHAPHESIAVRGWKLWEGRAHG